MTDNVGKAITAAVSPIIALYLSEAETESYPYAVYTYEIRPVMTKDGIDSMEGTAGIDVFGDDYDVVLNRAELIASAMDGDFSSYEAVFRFAGQNKSCSEGVWRIAMNYNVKQN